ncbi:MAG TPA: TlpA disulfide reductase family protein [Chitinophagaceae bacterium]|nr:TlpA disulfide reductase family protein [Chitinophagaceae bacterium]
MRRFMIVLAVFTGLFSCTGSKSSKKGFQVTGIITNSPARMIYLEEVPMATMQAIVVDSASIANDGKYSLSADSKEENIFNLRLGGDQFPLTSVINDVPMITLDATFTKDKMQLMENYVVKGSPASQQLKNFMYAFTDKIRDIYISSGQLDSLRKTNASDSVISAANSKLADSIKSLKDYSVNSIKVANNPSLTMFELGYYQSTANNPSFKIEVLTNDEVSQIVNDLAVKFPSHQGLAAIKRSLDAQMEKPTGWVGRQAPEIALPDVNGKEVKLSSFRGKYVLVDFWASWCGPCRHENPNVVKAYDRFKDKNFTILGVSLDKSGEKDKWLQAIKEDKLSWTQVSELNYWDSKVVSLYNIDGIPYNVLVDPNGKIIGEALRGEDLEAKLAEVLK